MIDSALDKTLPHKRRKTELKLAKLDITIFRIQIINFQKEILLPLHEIVDLNELSELCIFLLRNFSLPNLFPLASWWIFGGKLEKQQLSVQFIAFLETSQLFHFEF